MTELKELELKIEEIIEFVESLTRTVLSSSTSFHINKSQRNQSRNSNDLPPTVFRNFLSVSTYKQHEKIIFAE